MTAATVLVTGAMGQVGRRTTQLLLDRGRAVIALDLDNEATRAAAAEFLPGSGTLVTAYVDLLDRDGLTALVAEHRPDAVVHLAAAVAPAAYRNPPMARRVNVEGTANLIAAAQQLVPPPLFVEASSASVYGSRNPHTHADLLTAATPTNPVDFYGEDKVTAERLVADSGLPHASLRLGGIISPDSLTTMSADHDLLVRSFPHDTRIHVVDARDVALAFANAVDRGPAIDGKILLVGGDPTSCLLRQQQVTDDLATAVGIGAIGPAGLLPGDPGDERGWGLTDWFDTTEAQDLLDFQEHSWRETCAWVAAAVPGWQRIVARLLAPLLRLLLRTVRRVQRRRDRRGEYADPWALLAAHYGTDVLANTHRSDAVGPGGTGASEPPGGTPPHAR